jgi:hypothetical protein
MAEEKTRSYFIRPTTGSRRFRLCHAMGALDGRAVAVTKMSISLHIANILREKELDESVVKSYLTTAADGKRYNVIFHKTGRAASNCAQEERLPRPCSHVRPSRNGTIRYKVCLRRTGKL